MGTYKNFIDTVDNLLTEAKNNKIIHLNTQKKQIDNNIIDFGEGEIINFGSCSYLGLEFNKKTIEGSINAIKRYGTQFSSSRAYVSIDLYKEYEILLEKIFGANIVITPTTTLGHIAAIPTLVNDNDAVILDHQVHSSVQNATNLLKHRNIHIETLKHNDMNMLENKLKSLLSKHNEVWYMADGIYSMYGDGLPAKQLEKLLNKYKNFRLYVDDAHGMSWAGKNGKGYTLSKMGLHKQMVLAVSLAKGYGSGGGVLVFPNKEDARIIRTCGGPMVTSGPLQPANLGAGIEAAKIHLSNEIYALQEELMDNIRFTNLMLEKSKLPVVFNSETPIFFIGTSLPKITFKIIERMKNDGFYTNLGIFPAVPIKNTGVRFTITRLHTFEQIESMINSLEKHYFNVLKEEKFDVSRIYEAFNIKSKQEIANNKIIENLEGNFNLKLKHYKSIKEIPQKDWDNLFNNKGNFDWNGLTVIENSFTNNKNKENNWDFDYVIIRDRNNEIVLATFFTTAINKDDMLAPSEISHEVEKERLLNPYYLTSRTLFMGSLFSEGEHIYLNKKSNYWSNALDILFEQVNVIKTKNNAQNIVFRDFNKKDDELSSIFINNGYYKLKMSNSFEITNPKWENETEFLSSLSSNSRKQVKKHVLKYSNFFKTRVTRYCDDPKKIKKWYNLYLNVKKKSLELNTYTLPYKLFDEMSKNKKWEKIELLLDNNVTAIIFSYINGNTYNPMLIGLDYKSNPNISSYRQAMYKLILRANELNLDKIRLGFSADIEKKRFGAEQTETFTFVSTESTYNETIISNTNTSKKRKLTTV